MNSQLSNPLTNEQWPNRLLIRPRPILGESRVGYLVRIVHSNGYESPTKLLNALKAVGKHSPIQYLKLLVGLTSEEDMKLAGPLPSRWNKGSNLPDKEHNYKYMRWCSECLRESAHLRNDWNGKYGLICDIHKVFLRVACTQCDATQMLDRNDVLFCRCGMDLRDCECEDASEFIRQMANLLDRPNKIKRGFEKGLNLQDSKARQLSFFLGQLKDGLLPPQPLKVVGLDRIDVVKAIAVQAVQMLEHWPNSFYRELECCLNRAKPGSSLRVVFGRLYRAVYIDCRGFEFDFLRKAFEEFLLTHWKGAVCNRNRYLSKRTRSDHPYISLSKASLLAGVELSKLRDLVSIGRLQIRTITTKSGRKIESLHKDELKKLRLLGMEMLNLGEVANYLDLSQRRLRILINAEILRPMIARSKSCSSRWRVSIQELRKFDLPIAEDWDYDDKEVVSLKHVLSYWKLSDTDFVELIRKILRQENGSFKVQRQASFGKALFLKRTLIDWLRSRREKAGLVTVDGAAKLLGIKQQVAYDLVKVGLLKSETSPKGLVIHPLSVEAFSNEYVSLSSLAKAMKTTPRKALPILGIVPATGPSVDGSRKYFFKRDDIRFSLKIEAALNT